jgi:hypothetical protein
VLRHVEAANVTENGLYEPFCSCLALEARTLLLDRIDCITSKFARALHRSRAIYFPPFLPYFCIHGPIQNSRPQRHVIRLLEFDHRTATSLVAAGTSIAAGAWRVKVNN